MQKVNRDEVIAEMFEAKDWEVCKKCRLLVRDGKMWKVYKFEVYGENDERVTAIDERVFCMDCVKNQEELIETYEETLQKDEVARDKRDRMILKVVNNFDFP